MDEVNYSGNIQRPVKTLLLGDKITMLHVNDPHSNVKGLNKVYGQLLEISISNQNEQLEKADTLKRGRGCGRKPYAFAFINIHTYCCLYKAVFTSKPGHQSYSIYSFISGCAVDK